MLADYNKKCDSVEKAALIMDFGLMVATVADTEPVKMIIC